MKRLLLVLVMMFLLVVGCASNRECISWNDSLQLQICGPIHNPANPSSWCWVKVRKCTRWIDKETGKDIVRRNGKWVPRY